MMKVLILLSLFIPTLLAAKPIRVMSVDTGTSLSHYLISSHVKEPFDSSYIDTNGHGTHIAGLILKNTCSEVEFISCKYQTEDEGKLYLIRYCFRRALLLKVDFVNFSSSGPGYYQFEYDLIERLIKNGTKVLVAAGNDSLDLNEYGVYPAAYNIKGLIVVGNLDRPHHINRSSNYGKKDMAWEIGTDIKSTLPDGKYGTMSGTSQATAIRTNRLIRKKCNEQ